MDFGLSPNFRTGCKCFWGLSPSPPRLRLCEILRSVEVKRRPSFTFFPKKYVLEYFKLVKVLLSLIHTNVL